MVQISHPYVTTGKTLVLARWNCVGKVMSLVFYRLSRLVITRCSIQKSDSLCSSQSKTEKLYTVSKNETGS